VAIIPRVISLYQVFAQRFTDWENHAHQSSHTASLTLKTFAISAIVAYLGLTLDAFVYVPFGEDVMKAVQTYVSKGQGDVPGLLKSPGRELKRKRTAVWEVDMKSARGRLNPSRLRDQMFAHSVTNQLIDGVTEIGLPYLQRAFEHFLFMYRNSKHGSKNKLFDEVPTKAVGKEKEFLERVKEEAALPECDLPSEYSEMVTQFGYVALWSTIWPLVPGM
jgi:anoctamin-10